MSGGIQFTWKGRMLCGVMGDDLLLRINRRDYDSFITEGGAKPMVMAGQTSKGWILVQSSSVTEPTALTKWVDRALAFVSTLPEKAPR